jgi:hypothetical protein
VIKFGNKKEVIFGMSVNKTEALNFIRKLIEENKLKTIFDRQFSLDELLMPMNMLKKDTKKET